MKIGLGRKVTISYREAGADGRAIVVIDIATDAGDLPHEHRDDLKAWASELLGVPIASLSGVDVKLERTGPPHSHAHPHEHEHPPETTPERKKQDA